MDLVDYRESAAEQERAADLLRMMPTSGSSALDVGCRDGYFSLLMAQRFERVVALDLTLPGIRHPNVECVRGDAADLPYGDCSFDFVFCAEVLEHIPERMLDRVCREIERVAKNRFLIGVPYRQDIRLHRTTCCTCGGRNPPWGHVNSFDEHRIVSLFPASEVEQVSFVGRTTGRTNALSAWLMDLAGNPYGTYSQDEPCIHCGQPLKAPPPRSLPRKVLTRMGFWARGATAFAERSRANWIHMLMSKGPD